jgi:ribonucleotide reductase beta subunit family protein with ferritin-like domain
MCVTGKKADAVREKSDDADFPLLHAIDVEVNNCYMKHYSQVFGPVEVQMMLSAFSNIETVHIAAYSHLLDTIGMPEVEYSAFLKYKEMKDKFDYMQNASHEIAPRYCQDDGDVRRVHRRAAAVSPRSRS